MVDTQTVYCRASCHVSCFTLRACAFATGGELAERQQKLGQLMNRLRKVGIPLPLTLQVACLKPYFRPCSCTMTLINSHLILQLADEFNIAVLITNQGAPGRQYRGLLSCLASLRVPCGARDRVKPLFCHHHSLQLWRIPLVAPCLWLTLRR